MNSMAGRSELWRESGEAIFNLYSQINVTQTDDGIEEILIYPPQQEKEGMNDCIIFVLRFYYSSVSS